MILVELLKSGTNVGMRIVTISVEFLPMEIGELSG